MKRATATPLRGGHMGGGHRGRGAQGKGGTGEGGTRHHHTARTRGFNFLLSVSATIENFNVVEPLSESAVIVYQTHKV